mmetsp:Transcript_19483/g.23698  ORF Transcript_19483/g.23698 Transcript_19483/m.23698 type:complete len:84 (+) Transcript_19483:803-1054(+)
MEEVKDVNIPIVAMELKEKSHIALNMVEAYCVRYQVVKQLLLDLFRYALHTGEGNGVSHLVAQKVQEVATIFALVTVVERGVQ